MSRNNQNDSQVATCQNKYSLKEDKSHSTTEQSSQLNLANKQKIISLNQERKTIIQKQMTDNEWTDQAFKTTTANMLIDLNKNMKMWRGELENIKKSIFKMPFKFFWGCGTGL
jgi:hypothetical protein